MNDTDIIRQDIAPNKRILVTSDIHGHLNHLRQVLKKAAFYDDDYLIIIGDIVDKGPESLKTLRYIMKLNENKNVTVLAGNVDIWRVKMIEDVNEATAERFLEFLISQRKWKGTCLFDEMTAECGFKVNSAAEILTARDIVLKRFMTELEFLSNRPIAMETQSYIFVHGGMPCRTLDTVHIGKIDSSRFLKYDRFMDTDIYFDKFVVAGHWPVTLYNHRFPQHNPLMDTKKKIISIDGGCGLKKDGQLNLIEIPDIYCDVENIKQYSYDELPVYIALENQEKSEDSVNVIWINNQINLLKKEEDFSYVEHIGTGKKLWISNDDIIDEQHCDDCTDNVLYVRKGDSLSVIKSTSRGYLVKRQGVTGWYYGKVERPDICTGE